MKNVNIYGSTGSIGTQTLNIIRRFRDRFNVSGLACGSNIELLEKQIKEFNPDIIYIKNKENISMLNFKGKIFFGEDGLKEFANYQRVDISLIAIVGTEGIIPTYESIKNSDLVALANKESLVSAGEFIITEAKKNNVKIIPVDSEHSAIFQCFHNKNEVRKIILTASGGPFFKKSIEEFEEITVQMALKHPTWDMGNKITIDSATLMNKGLEVIEARWLFDLPGDKIDIIIHPQSIVHSFVEYQDGALLAQLGSPDMEVPISYALFYPERAELDKGIEMSGLTLQFFKPDFKKFPTLEFAYKALAMGKGYPAALNKANEIAVMKFLSEKISFTEIFRILEKIFKFDFLESFKSIEDVFLINKEVERILQ